MSRIVTIFRKGCFFTAFVFTCLLFSVEAFSQPQITLRYASVTQWPMVQLNFQVSCNGAIVSDLKSSDLEIWEVWKTGDMELKQNVTLQSPDTSQVCAISAVLVFDESGSMGSGTPSGIAAEKAAGHAFVDLMDGVVDEAAVIGFDQAVYSLCEMTTLKPVVNSAIDMLAAMGATAMYDGMIAGLQELINHGNNASRGVILITDGGDGSSTRSPGEVTALAISNGIPIYTIGFGIGADATALADIANKTHGIFYHAITQVDLVSDMISIHNDMRGRGLCREYSVSYESGCMSQTTHTVALTLPTFCGGPAWAVTSFKVPNDTLIHFQLPQTSVELGKQVDIPILLAESLPLLWFDGATFTISFDTLALEFVGFQTPPGTIYAGSQIAAQRIPGGVQGRIPNSVKDRFPQPSMPLFYATFKAISSKGFLNLVTNISLTDWEFVEGCFLAVTPAGCEMDIVPPTDMHDAAAAKDFTLYPNHPNPFSANTTISYDLPASAFVTLTIHDLLGREIFRLVNERQSAGHYDLPFGTNDLPSGMYLYRLNAGTRVQTMRMVVLK